MHHRAPLLQKSYPFKKTAFKCIFLYPTYLEFSNILEKVDRLCEICVKNVSFSLTVSLYLPR